jgi:hypothetical protein
LKDSKEELLQIIDTWAEAKRLEAFFADAERRARDLPDGQRERTIERLRQARALIGSTDALERFKRVASAGRSDKICPNLAKKPGEVIWGYLWGHFWRLAAQRMDL